jgi:SAM-dependent methyltransferase
MNVDSFKSVNETLGRYYTKCFAEYGATARGVDWHDAESLALHYDKMLSVIEPGLRGSCVSILDIGCGFGGLLERADQRGIALDYTGIDLVGDMIHHGAINHPTATFVMADVFAFNPKQQFDYVVANGVLTEKLDVSIREFGRFSRRMILRMFALASRGIAFNMMTSNVNYMAPNLYYQSPGELIAFCAAELSSKWIMDHNVHPHYDFTIYVYR